MTEKETGNAQPGGCVDVLPRCYHELDGADELFVGNVRALMNEVWVFKQSDHT